MVEVSPATMYTYGIKVKLSTCMCKLSNIDRFVGSTPVNTIASVSQGHNILSLGPIVIP
jgi:hypothetical protein